MIRALLLAALLWLSVSAQCQTRFYITSPGPDGTSATTAGGAVYQTCYNVLLAAHPAGGFSIQTNGSYEYAVIATGLQIANAVLGTQFSISCSAHFPSYIGGDFVRAGSITVSQTCVSGASSSLIMMTTIGSIDQFGRAVPVDTMPNPQCRFGCVVQRPSGGQGVGACLGYLPFGTIRAVGESMWVSCSEDSIAQTGLSCNFASADVQGVTPTVDIPSDGVVDNGQATGGGGSLTDQESAALINISNQSLGIASTSSITASGVTSAVNALNGVRSDLAAASSNAATRHSELTGIFNGIKGVLDSIESKTGTGTGTGTGGSGIPVDGFVATGDAGSLGDLPVAGVPEGGLKSPGESGFTDFKTTLNATGERAAGACPTWTLNVDYLSSSYVLDSHCAIFESNRGALEAIMTVVWSVMALGLVLRA